MLGPQSPARQSPSHQAGEFMPGGSGNAAANPAPTNAPAKSGNPGGGGFGGWGGWGAESSIPCP